MFAHNKCEKAKIEGSRVEKFGWNTIRNNKSMNYEQLKQKLIKTYEKLGRRMSLKFYFLHSYLHFFSENIDDISEEHGEIFHQDISTLERRYQWKWDCNMMGGWLSVGVSTWQLMDEKRLFVTCNICCWFIKYVCNIFVTKCYQYKCSVYVFGAKHLIDIENTSTG